ncbi:MAG: hypothetical protein LBJ96_00100 [Holosporaceae bacterium]|jgi:hypothetical protein|nr:hypothetical protein [Holosporaceae bacterium]
MPRSSIEAFRKKISFCALVTLTSCASWNEEFEGEVVRAYPHASIHKISQMANKGIIKEDDLVLSGDMSARLKVFKDGNISRGVEDVRRMYMTTYEDASKNLHTAHHLYLIVKPAEWSVTDR